jgi:type II secretory pathway component GspD/PulD (secretin)
VKNSQPGADALPADAGNRPDSKNSAEADLDSAQGPPTARRAPAAGPAAQPIRIGRSPDGRMVISSPDTQALDRLEDLLTEITPPRKDYKIFKMKYKSTWAYGVALNLKDFFEEKDKNKPTRSRWEFFYGMPSGGDSKDDERRLSKRRPLKFIADSDSNSILVTGADQQQLKIIEELIAAYDIPESKDSAAVRKTKIVRIRHSKARVIADAVKDVYRDLLSAKKTPEAMYTYVNNFGGDDEKKPDTPTKFKGLLSIGVDELSNTLVVSAAEGLVETIVATIEALDDAALPTVNRMQVLKIDRNIDADELQKRLKNLVTKPPQPRVPQPQQPNQNGQQPVNPDSTVVIDNN